MNDTEMEMTIKEIADLLGVTKPTIQKAVKDLSIQPIVIRQGKNNKKYVIPYDDFIKIIKFLRPDDFEKFSEKAKKAEKDSEKDENIEKQEGDNSTKSAKSTANSANETAKSEKSENESLIDVLQKQLDEKQETIRHQQEQLDRNQDTIDALIKVNATLTARVAMLEDKQEPPQEPIILSESAARESEEEPKEKRTLRDRIKAFFA